MADVVLRISGENATALAAVKEFAASLRDVRVEQEQVATSAKASGATVQEIAAKNVTSAIEQRDSLRGLISEYVSVGRAGVESGERQAEGSRLAREAQIQLGQTAGATAEEIKAGIRAGITAEAERRAAIRESIVEIKNLSRSGVLSADEIKVANEKVAASYAQIGEAAKASTTAGARAREEAGVRRGFESRVTGVGGFLAGPGFIGGALLGIALDKTVKTALEAASSINRLDQAIRDARASVSALNPVLEHYEETSRKLGFTDTETRDAETRLIQAFGATKQAMNELGVAQDLARAKNIDLGTATRGLILLQEGNTRAAKEFGLALPDLTAKQWKAKAAQDGLTVAQERGKVLYDELTPRIRDQAQAFANSPTGKIQAFHAEIDHLQETIGRDLLPVVSQYLTEVDKWLAKGDNQKRITHDVMAAVHDLGVALHDAADLVKFFYDAADPVVHLMGGWSNVLKAIVAIKFGSVVAGWVPGLSRLIGSNAEGTGLTAASTRSGRLLSNLGGLAKMGGLTLGVDLLFKSRGDSGAKGFFESLFGAGLVGGTIGWQVGGPWGAGIGLALGVSADIFEHLIHGGGSDKYPYKGGSEVRDLGHGVTYDAATGQYYLFRNGTMVAISAQRARQILGVSGQDLQDRSNAPGGYQPGAQGGQLANPVPGGSFGRIDQGVDYSVKLVRAIASGVIVSVGGGFAGPAGQPGRTTFIKQRFNSPIRVHGRTYYGGYYAEGVALVQAGDHVRAGEPVMRGGSVEIGFLLGTDLTLPPLRGGIGAGTQPSQAGQDYAALVQGLGGPAGGTGSADVQYGPSTHTPTAPPTKHTTPAYHGPTGDALLPQSMRRTVSRLAERARKEIADAQASTGDDIAAYYDEAVKTMRQEEAALRREIKLLERKLKGSTGGRRKAIEEEINKIEGQLSTVRKSVTSALQQERDALKSAVSSLQSKVSSAWANVQQSILGAFEATTQSMIDAVGKQFFQGVQTPEEAALAAAEAADQAQSLQDALSQAQSQLATDVANAADQATIAADQKAVQIAQHQIDLANLEAAAQASRIKADQDYADAVAAIQQQRQDEEEHLTVALGDFGDHLQDGSATFADLQPLLDQYGVQLGDISDGSFIFKTNLDDLHDSAKALDQALRDLAELISKITGKKVDVPPPTTTPNPSGRAPGGHYKTGGIIPGPMIGPEDTINVNVSTGEGILSRDEMRLLLTAAIGGRTATPISKQPIYVLGTTQAEVGRALARIITPAQQRRVGFQNI